jgi:glucosyl-3-phosphoglycerate synthase
MNYTAAHEEKDDVGQLNILVPVETTAQAQEVLPLALTLLGNDSRSCVNLIAVTRLRPQVSLSQGALLARRLRNDLDKLASENSRTGRLHGSIVSHQPWEDIKGLIEERPGDQDLLLLPWRASREYVGNYLTQVLRDPPCNVVIARPASRSPVIKRILLPVRGGPFANLSLQIAVRIARASSAEITLLRVLSSDDDPTSQMLREQFTGLSDSFPEITEELQIVGEAGTDILRELKEHQAVILGASAASDTEPIGLIASLILKRENVTTLIVKTKEPFRPPITPPKQSDLPVLIKVEKWFAENTFHNREFSEIGQLIDLKRKQGVRISLGLPSVNEEATIGGIISSIKGPLMDDAPLLDEIALIDSNSTDLTRKIAAEMGVTPYVHQGILSRLGSLRGKGEALWKSLYLLRGDLILWMDTDIANPHPRMVYGVVGPMLRDSRIQYVKGFYRRPVKLRGGTLVGEGGRVTELLARPIINLFFPELSGLVQPLGGIYGGRRAALEQVPFYSGYGVEIGLLLDLLDRFGLRAIAQVDLEEVLQGNQDLRALSKISFAILQVFAYHLKQRGKIDPGVEIERTMKLIRHEGEDFHLQEIDVHEQKRPPMIEVKEYRGRHTPLLS